MRGLQKNKFKRIFYSYPTLIVLLTLIFFFGRATWEIYQKERVSAYNAAKAEEELNTLKARERALTEEVAMLSTPEGVEREIRKKYSVTREGEEMFVIVDSNQAEVPPEPKKEGWWSRVKRFFSR